MTPYKTMKGLSLVGTCSTDADVSMDADDSHFSESMLSSPPKAASSRTRHAVGGAFTASRLFADDDDSEDELIIDPSKSNKPRVALKPLDLNLDLSSEDVISDTGILSRKTKFDHHHQRKRHAEQHLDGRDLSFDDAASPVDMCASPRISPSCYRSPASHRAFSHKSPSSFRTLDGRTVQSKNPFSPMNTFMEEATPTRAPPAPIAASLNFPVSFGDAGKKKDGDEASLPNVAPLLRHRLHKRETQFNPTTFKNDSCHYNSFTRDGYPEKKGQYSFTGSPIKETDFGESVGYNYHKLRRINRGDDVVAAASHAEPPQTSSWKNNLQVDTNAKVNYYNRYDEISPTDAMSFPMMSPSSPSTMPPTPSKPRQHARRPKNRYTPVKKSVAPNTPMLERRARARSFDEDEDNELSPGTMSGKHFVPLSRYYSDFDVLGELGNGSFGNVFKVLSRLDGCMYAIKVAHRPAKGNTDKDRMLKEVYALAALSDQADTATFHIVRYHQAWMEENRLYIQTELCTSTFAGEMKQGPLSVKRRYKFLREICLALEFIHKNGMVHLDIKPENIFIKNDQFKLGDFGLVSKISYHQDVEEGDSRYMSIELLGGDHADLTKSDIFSLGITLYEACLGGKPLPTNGPHWQALRSGAAPELPVTPDDMQRLMKLMMNPSYATRPSAGDLLKRPLLLSEEQKALLAERNKVVEANLRLAAQTNRLMMLTPSLPPRKGLLQRRNTYTGG